MTATYTYDPTTDVGRCRLLVRDNDPDALDDETALFSDEDYRAFLAIEIDVRLAAAAALETIASDQALKLQVLKAGSTSLDGAAVSDAILRRAAILRQQAGSFDPTTGLPGGWDIAEQVTGPFGYRERVLDQAIRAG